MPATLQTPAARTNPARDIVEAPQEAGWRHDPYAVQVLHSGDYMYAAPPCAYDSDLPSGDWAGHWTTQHDNAHEYAHDPHALAMGGGCHGQSLMDNEEDTVQPSARPLPRPFVAVNTQPSHPNTPASSVGHDHWVADHSLSGSKLALDDSSFQNTSADTSVDATAVGEDDLQMESQRYIVALVVSYKKLHFYCEFPVEVGELVVYECDRGFGVAPVGAVYTKKPKEIQGARILLHVLRRPSTEEAYNYTHVLPDECAAALAFCRQQSLRKGLPLDILACDIRFDREKVAFQYRSLGGVRVKFVDLLKVLHARFHVRVWMDDVDRLYDLGGKTRRPQGAAAARRVQ